MSELDRAHDRLNDLIKGTLEVNSILEHVEGTKAYKKMIDNFHQAFVEQLGKLLKSNVFEDIDNAIHPVQKDGSSRINSDSDELEIEDMVRANMQALAKQKNEKMESMFADFLILVFVMGGQDFLNKHNIPATFDLRNKAVVDSIKEKARATIKGIDETTQKWVAKQISEGRQAGLSNSEIADKIKEVVPETYLNRSERIVRTETSVMVGESEHKTAVNNGASHKEWITVAGACDICGANEDAGMIGINEVFPSGDKLEPAHPNCRCIVEYMFTPFMGTIWSGQ